MTQSLPSSGPAPATDHVRVRFAPSPTGWLHVGGLRTALYNYLFARHHGGTCILRIEDTDRSRYVEGAVDNLLDTLRWAGLVFDEGPDVGGPCAPYVQSQRLQRYREQAEVLLHRGRAYRCFCTPADLEAMRVEQERAGVAQMYDRRCRMLGADEVRMRVDAGMPHVIRLATPLLGEVDFHDLIRGRVEVAYGVIDDQVLLKSDGYPTYHLANVVDDHDMEITHVIRGEEWLPSTAKHILLYESFEWTPPRFAHLPLLLNPDRTKLSKRQGDVAVEDYRARGILPEALVNFVALLGWNTSDTQELYSLEQLISEFSLDRVGKAGAVFDLDKLLWFNGQYLRAQPIERIAELCRPVFTTQGWSIDETRYLVIIEAITKYLTTPRDAVEHAAVFFQAAVPEHDDARALLGSVEARSVLSVVVEHIDASTQWDREIVKNLLKSVQKATGAKGAALYLPVRVALTGRMHGPDLPLIAEVFGRDACRDRIAAALA